MLIDPTEKCKTHAYRTLSEIYGTIGLLNSHLPDYPEDKQNEVIEIIHSLEVSVRHLKGLVEN